MNYDIKLNYSADIVRCVRGMPRPDLNPARYIVFGGAFLKVEGWQRPGRRWLLPRKADLIAAAICLGALATAVWAFMELWQDLVR